MDSIFQNVIMLNNSKILAGISMILMNIGSRHVIADLGIVHQNILSSEIFKKIIIFAMFFVATRDVIIAFILMLSYVLIIDGILHEKRKFCIVPKKYIHHPNIPYEQYMKAKDIVLQYEINKSEVSMEATEAENVYDTYKKNIMVM